jgi:hypothetical protein
MGTPNLWMNGEKGRFRSSARVGPSGSFVVIRPLGTDLFAEAFWQGVKLTYETGIICRSRPGPDKRSSRLPSGLGEHMTDVQVRRKLQIGRVKTAVAFPVRNFRLLIKLGFFPGLTALVTICFVMKAHWPVVKSPASMEETQAFFHALQSGMMIASIVIFIAWTPYFVGIIRFIVCNERPGWTLLRLRRYELSYAAVGGIPMALSFALDYLFVFIVEMTTGFSAGAPLPTDPKNRQLYEENAAAGDVVAIVLGIVFLWLCIRFALLLPHAAVAGEISPRLAWTRMKGNFWRLVFAALLLSLALILPFLVVSVVAVMVGGGALEGLYVAILKFLSWTPEEARRRPDILWNGMFLSSTVPLTLVSGWMMASYGALIAYLYKDLVDEPAVP